MRNAYFFRKITNLKYLNESTALEVAAGKKGNPFKIFKVVELPGQEYQNFTNSLLQDKEFIAEVTNQATVEKDGTWNCILVKQQGKQGGILVHSTGYTYARYTAVYPAPEIECEKTTPGFAADFNQAEWISKELSRGMENGIRINLPEDIKAGSYDLKTLLLYIADLLE